MDNITTTTDMFEFEHEPIERIFFGLTYSLVSFFFMIPYLFMLWVMMSDERFSGILCYKLMFQMGICDQLMLIGHINGGIMTLFKFRYPLQAIKIIGGLMGGGWWGYIWFMCLTAINRLLVITDFYYEHYVFSLCTTKVYIAIGWCVVIFYVATCQLELQLFDFDYEGKTWYYATDTTQYADLAMQFEYWYGSGFILISVGCYIGVFVYVRFTHQAATTVEAQQAEQHHKRELSIAVQAMLITLVAFTANIWWNIAFTTWPSPSNLIVFTCNFLWQCNIFINPIIYMTLNSKLRRAVIKRIRQTLAGNIVNPSI